jgi:hypothetical protein
MGRCLVPFQRRVNPAGRFRRFRLPLPIPSFQVQPEADRSAISPQIELPFKTLQHTTRPDLAGFSYGNLKAMLKETHEKAKIAIFPGDKRQVV